MKNLKRLFDFYINSSIHVALSCFALVRITQMVFHICGGNAVANFAFFGTIVGYNFVKYGELARTKKLQMRSQLRLIVFFSFCSFIMTGYYFFQLERITQIVGVVLLGFTLLYTLPFFPNRKNARNWAGVKIYIVSLCWVGVTVFLPLLKAKGTFGTEFFIFSIQRFILIFVLILIFEIIDLKHDDPNLKTVPQQIGVENTKKLGYLLMVLFCLMEVFNFKYQLLILELIFKIAIACITGLFLAFANEKRSKYYTSFWAESIPVLWWVCLLLL
jgi:uncharacterized membrane protein